MEVDSEKENLSSEKIKNQPPTDIFHLNNLKLNEFNGKFNNKKYFKKQIFFLKLTRESRQFES